MSSIRETRQVWQAILKAHQRGVRTALLTLAAVRGSAYRRPGAKMMMAEDGEMFGTLSGGCLEGDLLHYAVEAMKSGKALIRQYDLTEDAMWGLGIGCKGTITVWVEPVNPEEPFWRKFGEWVSWDQRVALWAQIPQGFRRLCTRSETFPTEQLTPTDRPWHSVTQYDGEVLWDVMMPPERLIIAGAGHDAIPLAGLAEQIGFEVTILDPRAHFNNEKRLPGAAHYLVRQAEEVDPVEVRDAFWVIMNHHQRRDKASLDLALRSEPQFVGMLGPRSRSLELLGDQNDPVPQFWHAPIGLNLGAETVDEVALSIAAELLAVRNRKPGGALNGQERIHD
jgi:xanthine/CO dehydrogenase XdhC/CoxF family maturation factor